MIAAERGTVLAANIWGKVKTVLQSSRCCFTTLCRSLWAPQDILAWGMIAQGLCWLVAGVTVLSGGIYLWQNRECFMNAKKWRKEPSTMQIFNPLTRQKRNLSPRFPANTASMSAGRPSTTISTSATRAPMVVFDTLRRYLEYRGNKVYYVSNITDIDDKLIAKGQEEGVTMQEVARRFEAEYIKDSDGLNVKAPTVRPRATEHIARSSRSSRTSSPPATPTPRATATCISASSPTPSTASSAT